MVSATRSVIEHHIPILSDNAIRSYKNDGSWRMSKHPPRSEIIAHYRSPYIKR